MLFAGTDDVFLDVDATLVNVSNGTFNENLIAILKQTGVKEVYLLTRYSVQVELSISDFSRLAVIKELEKHGITVRGILTPLDISFEQHPGTMYERHIRPLEEAIETLKQDEWFGALDVITSERKATISNRFRNFKTAYKNNRPLEDCPGITEANIELMRAVYEAHRQALENLDVENIERHEAIKKISKGAVRNELRKNSDIPAVFVDDSSREKDYYVNDCPEDIILAPPLSTAFEDKAIYMPAALFVLNVYSKMSQKIEDKQPYASEFAAIADALKDDPDSQLILYLSNVVLSNHIDDQLHQKIKDLVQNSSFDLKKITDTFNFYFGEDHWRPSIQPILEDIFAKSIKELIDTEIINSLPQVFASGIIAKIRRFFWGDESSDTIAQVFLNLKEYVSNNFNLYPKECLKALSELRLQCKSPILDQEIKWLIEEQRETLTPENSLMIMKDLIIEGIQAERYPTGLWNLTGVHAENRNIPHGVKQLLEANDLEAFRQIATTKSQQSSFFRKEGTRKLYEELATQPAQSNGPQ